MIPTKRLKVSPHIKLHPSLPSGIFVQKLVIIMFKQEIVKLTIFNGDFMLGYADITNLQVRNISNSILI